MKSSRSVQAVAETARGASFILNRNISKQNKQTDLSQHSEKDILEENGLNIFIDPAHINNVDDTVFIGSMEAANNYDYLTNLGITHIINTTREIPNFFENRSGIHYLKLNLDDNIEMGVEDLLSKFEPTFGYISSVLKFNPKVKILIHCRLGKSRSASIVIYYLMKRYNVDYETAFLILKKKRPIIQPNSWYQKQLLDVSKILGEHRNNAHDKKN